MFCPGATVDFEVELVDLSNSIVNITQRNLPENDFSLELRYNGKIHAIKRIDHIIKGKLYSGDSATISFPCSTFGLFELEMFLLAFGMFLVPEDLEFKRENGTIHNKYYNHQLFFELRSPEQKILPTKVVKGLVVKNCKIGWGLEGNN